MKSKNAKILGVIIVVVVIVAAALFLYLAKPSHCQDSNVDAVYSCTDGSLRVVSKAAGAGYKIIKPDGSEVNCPVIAQPSDECREALDICSDVNLC